MRSRLFFGLFGCVLGLALAPPRSEAQVLRLPTGFMWGSRLPDPAFDYQNDPYIKPIVHASVTDAILKDENIPNNQSGWVDFPIEDPVGFGRAVANRVRFRQVPAGKVVITIQGFGNDNHSLDVPRFSTEVDEDTNFFRRVDRIGLGTSDDEWITFPFGGFPVPHQTPVVGQTPDDYWTARYYRHPFLINNNGNPDPSLQNTSPLRAWMVAFCQGYKAEKLAQAAIGITIPDPTFFAFDTEPTIQPDRFQNWVFLLRKLAGHSVNNQSVWSTWPVPGYNGATLATLYAAFKNANPGLNLPTDITHTTLGLDPTELGDVPRNINIMRWYSEICLRAQNEVMNHAAYGPIHAAWPQTNPATGEYLVRVGNYADFRTDGGTTLPNGITPERTGWFMDRPAGNNDEEFPNSYLANPLGPQPFPNDVFPRLNFSTNREGAQLRFTGSNSRYLGVKSWASGDMDSPVLYPQTSEGLLLPYTQKQYYKEGWPLDTNLFDITMRNARRQVEATINSNGGQNSNRFVPWLRMSSSAPCAAGNEFCAPEYDPNAADLYYNEIEFRQMQRMIRSKNARDCLFFTEPPKYDPPPTPAQMTAFNRAWTQTSKMVRRVYSNKILKYTRATGPVVVGGGAGPYVPYDTARLEFTIANPTNANEPEYNVDVWPKPVPIGGPYIYTTALIVEFEMTDYGPGDTYLGDNVGDLHLECWVTHPGVTGEIYFWYQTNSQTGAGDWYSIQSSTAPNTYGFWAPQSAGDGKYRTRQFFDRGYMSVFEDPADSKKKVRYKFVHTITSTTPLPSPQFRSRYDLIQMTPITNHSDNSSSMASQPQADTNGDGIINETDWSTFVESWLTDEASADLNLNSEIDPEDADIFVEAYINGG